MDSNPPTNSRPAWYDYYIRQISAALITRVTSAKIDERMSARCLLLAARLYDEAVARDPAFHDAIRKEIQIGRAFFQKLARLARGQIDLRLAVGNYPHGNFLRNMTIGDQRRAMAGGLPFLHANGEVSSVHPADLSLRQARQLFSFKHIRSIPEQRDWLKSRSENSATPATTTPPAPT